MNIYNLDKLIKVVYHDFYPSTWYIYKKEKKFLGFITQKEGVYYELLSCTYEGLDIPKNHTLIDGVIYENPEVILYYQADHSKHYYFNTFDEAKEFVENITFNGNHCKWTY
jgi:hypothetical protein